MNITFKTIIGKTIIVGITYMDKEEKIIKMIQYYGKIITADKEQGIVIKDSVSKEIFAVPPELSAIKIATPGEYILKSTGRVILNPDFLTTWICDI